MHQILIRVYIQAQSLNLFQEHISHDEFELISCIRSKHKLTLILRQQGRLMQDHLVSLLLLTLLLQRYQTLPHCLHAATLADLAFEQLD